MNSKFGWDPNWFCFKLSYDMIHKFERFKFKITRYDLNLNWESNLKSVTNLILYICMPRVEEWKRDENKTQGFYSFTSTHINVCEPDSLRKI